MPSDWRDLCRVIAMSPISSEACKVSSKSRTENDGHAGDWRAHDRHRASNYCSRYRPAARQPQENDLIAAHLGFRTVLNREDSER